MVQIIVGISSASFLGINPKKVLVYY